MQTITIQRFKSHNGTMVGIGTDTQGRQVAFGPDRATYIMAAPILSTGSEVKADIEDWRIITTR